MGVFSKLKDLVGIEEVSEGEIGEAEIQAAAAKLERKQIDSKNNYAPAKAENREPLKSSPQL